MSVLHRLSLSHKFLILGALALGLVALPTSLYVNRALGEISVARLEVAGTQPAIAIQKVVQLTQQHRGISAGMLANNEALAARRPPRARGGEQGHGFCRCIVESPVCVGGFGLKLGGAPPALVRVRASGGGPPTSTQ